VVFVLFFSNPMQCPFDVDHNSGVLYTKEQLVGDSLGEAFLGGPIFFY
jgi:hypothetical protein